MQSNSVMQQLQKSEESLVMALRDYVKAAVAAHLHEMDAGVQGVSVNVPAMTLAMKVAAPQTQVGVDSTISNKTSINDSLRSLELLLANSSSDVAQTQIIADIQAMSSKIKSMSEPIVSDIIPQAQSTVATQTSTVQSDRGWFSSLSGWMKKVREG